MGKLVMQPLWKKHRSRWNNLKSKSFPVNELQKIGESFGLTAEEVKKGLKQWK